jgi:hypothetical protein
MKVACHSYARSQNAVRTGVEPVTSDRQSEMLPLHQRTLQSVWDSNPYRKSENLASWPLDEQIMHKKSPGCKRPGFAIWKVLSFGSHMLIPRSYNWIYLSCAGNKTVLPERILFLHYQGSYILSVAHQVITVLFFNKKTPQSLAGRMLY